MIRVGLLQTPSQSIMRWAIDGIGWLAFRAGSGTFAKLFQLGAEAAEFVVEREHGLVLLGDMALEPRQTLLEVHPPGRRMITGCAGHGAARPRRVRRASFPARAESHAGSNRDRRNG